MISAKAHTDDYAIELEFDATPFFVVATKKELLDLAECAWGHDYPADAIAYYLKDLGQKDFEGFFTYLGIRNNPRLGNETTGFEVQVDRDEAIAWIQKNRPRSIKDVLKAETKQTPLDQATNPPLTSKRKA
jgi:hypothetical protein